ncbi:MAG: PAS domain S-box protein [Marinilabiliaceae bacterium]|nr:PAS domain S-box protein [Marinilabiliaceae bacterium]
MKNKKQQTVFKYLSPRGFSEIQWYAAFVAVIVVLFIGWTSVMSLLGFSVSFFSIAYLHRSLFVWLFDIAVVLLPLFVLYISNYRRIKLNELKRKIDDLQGQIDTSIIMAGKIGAGQELEEQTEDEESELQKALLALGKNLSDTKEKEQQFGWVSKGKEKISDILRVNNDLEELAVASLQGIVSYYGAVQGVFFILDDNGILKAVTQYAYDRRRYEKVEIEIGHGLVGAAAYEKQIIYRTEIPDDYFTITSGLLNDQKPKSILIIPLLQEQQVQGVLELSFFRKSLPDYFISLAEEIGNVVGGSIYNMKNNLRTENLLHESQKMTETLRKNEEQLRENAREMMEAQEQLETSNKELAEKMREVELAQKKLQALLTNASEFISIYDENRELVFESPSIRRILGYEADEEVHGMDEEMMTPRGYKSICSMFDYLLETPGGEAAEQYTYLKKNGEKIFLETQGKNLIHDPAIRGLIFNTRDITERKRAEKEERMKSRMQSLSENSPDMIIRTNTKGKMVYANPAASNFLQKDVAELVNMRISEIDTNPNFVQYITDTLKDIRRSKAAVESEIEVEVEGEQRIVEIKGIPEFGEDETLESVLYSAHDVTELKRIEQEVKDKNKKIQDSINYGKRIQMAIMPEASIYQQSFPNSFMFYRPKDVVSGDFPWYFEWGDVSYVAAVDCTGHGVPGAILSIIGYLMLTNIVDNGHELTAAQILDRLHAAVRRTLRQDVDGANGREGMDIGLCRIDKSKKELQFAGAHRPLYYMRDGEFTEYKASRKGIGGIPLPGRPEKDFENNVIEYKEGDRFFVFSDGLPDQLGGGPGVKKKYQTSRFKDLLDRDKNESMVGIEKDLIKDFYEWVGDEKQVDDVLLIGIEL